MFRKEWVVRQILSHNVFDDVSCYRKSCPKSCVHFVQVRQQSFLSLCGRPFLPLRLCLSDEGVLCVMIPLQILTSLNQLFRLARKFVSRFWEESGKSLQTYDTLRRIFCFHRITLNPVRELILYDQSIFVPTPWLISHVPSSVATCDWMSKFCESVQGHPCASLV